MNYLLRDDSLMDMLTWATRIGVDPRELFALSTVNCITDTYKSPCSISWSEIPRGRINTPSRMNLKSCLALAEKRLSQKLGYFVGPTYTEGEAHQVVGWNDRIRTRFSKVLKTGTRQITPVAVNVPQTREFDDPYDYDLNTCVTYTIGTPEQPIKGIDRRDLCNLIFFPPGYELEMGHRIRPFEIVSFVNGVLKVRVPIWVVVERNRYIKFPIYNNEMLDEEACDPDVFWDDIRVYKVCYTEPSGTLVLNERYCGCPDGCCAACTRKEIPVCLIPEDPENGVFTFKPLINNCGFEEAPCWEIGDLGSCCVDLHGELPNHKFTFDDFCNAPLYLKINYLSGCSDSCYNDECFPDEVCECLRDPVAFLAAACLGDVCDCEGCTTQSLLFYQGDLRKLSMSASAFKTVYDRYAFTFGHTQGAIMAWDSIKNLDFRVEYLVV